MSYVKSIELLCNSIIAFMKWNRNFTDNEKTISHTKVNLHYKRMDANATDFPNQKIISHMSIFLNVRIEWDISVSVSVADVGGWVKGDSSCNTRRLEEM